MKRLYTPPPPALAAELIRFRVRCEQAAALAPLPPKLHWATNQDCHAPLAARCMGVSLAVQKRWGGVVITGKVGAVTHYWNRLPRGIWVDLTSAQFGGDNLHVCPNAVPWAYFYPAGVRWMRQQLPAKRFLAALATLPAESEVAA